MIQIVGPRLSQWDTGRSISVSGSNATHAHIANRGDSHAPIMDIVDGEVKIPDYLMQTGKDLCVYLVLDGITQESKTFSVQKREKPENYVYEDDRRNYIYELITDAKTATEAANRAAETANAAASQALTTATTAAQTANQAATNADTAANSAIAAAGKVDQSVNTANIAAKNANEAAAKAEHTAKALMVVGGAGGANISLDNAIDQFLVGLRICGKTTQNGTPTPDAPVELVSVGTGGSITVNVAGKSDAQSMTVATPNGLPGIHIPSSGNYTDVNGQQWVCDEKDYARGVYVRRIGSVTLNGTQSFGINVYQLTTLNRYLFEYYPTNLSNETIDIPAISDKLIYAKWDTFTAKETRATVYATSERLIIFLPDQTIRTVDAFKAYLANNPIKVMYQLKTPTETPLSSEEISAYAALRTYRKSTTVSNDASAHMELEYVMDAKKYIDGLVKEPPARISNVTLLASAWTGSEGLYSQVVTIDGITEYSKVDLLPSVEQLAIFHNKDVTFHTENKNGVLTVYAIGDKPLLDYTMQAQITEVSV